MNDTPRDPKTLDDRRNTGKLWYGLLAACALLFAADALYHKHAHFAAESWFGFYGLYAFAACAVLVLAAKALRRMLMRSEDYYDNADD